MCVNVIYCQDELKDLEGDDDDDAGPSTSQSSSGSAQPGQGGSRVVAILQERLENYTEALRSAKSAGDTSKQRRADRGLKVN